MAATEGPPLPQRGEVALAGSAVNAPATWMPRVGEAVTVERKGKRRPGAVMVARQCGQELGGTGGLADVTCGGSGRGGDGGRCIGDGSGDLNPPPLPHFCERGEGGMGGPKGNEPTAEAGEGGKGSKGAANGQDGEVRNRDPCREGRPGWDGVVFSNPNCQLPPAGDDDEGDDDDEASRV